jgi:hypothetical protein
MTINLNILSKFDDKGVKQATGALGGLGKGIGKAFAVVGTAVAAAGAATLAFGVAAAKGAEEAAIAQRRLDNIAESMGLFGAEAGKVSERLGKFAEAQELIVGVDADIIKNTQSKLLTFKELAATADTVGGAMDRATMAALDLAGAGFGTAETNAIQLGKALNDPIKGITALGRAGVTFTEQEKEKIKTLVESGKMMEAQNVILKAIETQVGGTAEATVSGFARMQLATNQVKDEIGMALLPAMESLFGSIAENLLPIMKELAEDVGPILASVITGIGDVIKDATDPTSNLGSLFSDMATFAKNVFDRMSELIQDALPGLQAMFENLREPVGKILDFLTTLAEIVLVAITDLITDEKFQESFERIAVSIGDFAVEAKRLAEGPLGKFLVEITKVSITGGVALLAKAFSQLASAFTNLNNALDALSGKRVDFNQIIKGAEITGIDFQGLIAGFLQKQLGAVVPKGVVPKFANGGIVPARAGGTLGIIGEAGQAEAVIPLDKMGSMGSKTVNLNITVNAGMGADGGEIGRQIVDQILRYERSSGRVFARA